MCRSNLHLFIFFIQFFSQPCFAQTTWLNDSLFVLNEKIRIAKLSNNNNIVLQSYFGNSFIANSSWASDQDFQKVSQFIQQGIDFAVYVNDYKYTAIGHIRIAGMLRNRNETDKAIQHVHIAISNADHIESDSLKAIAYIELGECYAKKTEVVESSKNFTKALDMALKGKNPSLESLINHRLAFLYLMAGDTDEAKRQIYKSVDINRKIGFGEGLIKDYTQLGRVTDEVSYIDTVFALADSLGLQNKIFDAKYILLQIYAFVHKDPPKTLNFLNTNRDIIDYMLKNGIPSYNYYLGQVFLAGNMPDSALFYLKLAEPELFLKYGKGVRKIYLRIGMSYQLKNDFRNAIYFYEKMLGYSKEFNDRREIAEVSDSLSKLYNQTGEFQKAYEHKLLATKIKDSLDVLSKGKDLVLLDLVRERKKQEEELREEGARIAKKHNLQYMGITIGICIVFLFFLVLGMFPVSKLVIKIFGFIYFICVFEFIILLIENSVLHPITHGDPLKLWLLKIVLIALLVPVQQVLEHKLIKFLQSRKLHYARTKFMGMKWWIKKKPLLKPEIPEDMASE